ncbi:hypothetical protein F5888DRAFT_1747519 [Russula emetica]|nr:hypothetical protein F5888DRAFT_1747519 [Russula emetica]
MRVGPVRKANVRWTGRLAFAICLSLFPLRSREASQNGIRLLVIHRGLGKFFHLQMPDGLGSARRLDIDTTVVASMKQY